MEAWQKKADTAAADPLLDPQVNRFGSHGFLVTPKW
jgi:hypothetical protein